MAGPAEELTAGGRAAVPRASLAIAAGAAALLLAVAPRYGWHRDELYFLEAGHHLAWGYVDQPPFTPLVARLAHELAPGNLVVLRALPAVSTALTIVLGGLFVRELGGGRRVQVGGAAVIAGGGFVLGVGHLLSTAVFDLTASNLLVSLPLALPVLPLSSTKVSATVNEAVAETVGWPELVEQVADVVAGLPAEERERVVLLTGSYGEAGAIDRFGPALGLPPAHSGHNGYGWFRQPRDDGATVVGVRLHASRLGRHFEECGEVATIDNGHGVDNEAQGAPIVVCRGLRGTWAEVWPQLRFLS